MSEQHFNGDRLRIARTYHGLSQQYLGDETGVSRQYIHQIENGSRVPSSDHLEALSFLLKVNTKYFYGDSFKQVTVDDVYFRKLKRTPVTLIHQTLSFGTFAEQIVNLLSKYVQFPEVNIPNIDVSHDESIENAAKEVRRAFGLDSLLPISNVTNTIEKNGPVVVDFKNAGSDIDALSMARGRPIIVRSTSKTAFTRVRFDLAHELGHLVMHTGLNDHSQDLEKQANRFAGAFLFPSEAFMREFPKTLGRKFDWKAIYRVKEKWGISVSAILFRARELGVIDPAMYKSGMMYLAKTGQRKVEWNDKNREIEEPKLLRIAIAQLESHGIGVGVLADALNFSQSMLEEILDVKAKSQGSNKTNLKLIWSE